MKDLDKLVGTVSTEGAVATAEQALRMVVDDEISVAKELGRTPCMVASAKVPLRADVVLALIRGARHAKP